MQERVVLGDWHLREGGAREFGVGEGWLLQLVDDERDVLAGQHGGYPLDTVWAQRVSAVARMKRGGKRTTFECEWVNI